MYTINITFKTDHDSYEEWLTWMNREWLPQMRESCDGAAFQLHKLLGHDDEEGTTSVLQIYIPSRAILNSYLINKQNSLQQQIAQRWGTKVLFFQTILEKIDS